jgi:YbbR domain-containing protein
VQIIRKNFGLKVLAVALATVGWAYVRFASNPIVATARFDQQFSVPIGAIDLPVGYVAHFTDREAVVTVETKRGEPQVKPDEIKAVLDLSNKGTGVYNVPVQLVAPNIAVQSLSPASVTLTIEKIETRELPIAFHYVGLPIAGVVVSNATIDPAVVSVQGPSSLLSQVSAVHVDVTLPGEAKNLDEMVRPVAVSPFGMEVSGLDVAPDLVRVRVRFVADKNVRAQK